MLVKIYINKTVVISDTEITGLLPNHFKNKTTKNPKTLRLNYVKDILFQIIPTVLPLLTGNVTELVSGRAEGRTQRNLGATVLP